MDVLLSHRVVCRFDVADRVVDLGSCELRMTQIRVWMALHPMVTLSLKPTHTMILAALAMCTILHQFRNDIGADELLEDMYKKLKNRTPP